MSGPPPGLVPAQGRAAGRYALLSSGRHLLPAAIVVGVVMSLFAAGPQRAFFLAASALLGLALLLLSRRRPVLLVDEEGYRVLRGGTERLAVRWTEVRRVLVDREERALYVDCGDRGRNLLVPPQSGFAFTFSDRERLVEQVLAAVTATGAERLEEVADLAKATGAGAPLPPAPGKKMP